MRCHLYRALLFLVVADVAAAGCDANAVSDGGPADAGVDGSVSVAPPPPPPVDGAVADGPVEATGPKICNPQDPRSCEVATAAEGVPCPLTFEAAQTSFTCATLPVGGHWLVGGCGDFLIASTDTARHSVQCLYDPSTHALVGSYGYDDCGAFCGGVNRVHWGVDLSPCGITPGSRQGFCAADGGPDAEAGSDAGAADVDEGG